MSQVRYPPGQPGPVDLARSVECAAEGWVSLTGADLVFKRDHRRYAFADFTVDLDAALVCRGNQELDLRPKSFEVLRFLIERSGRLVEREELMQAIWPDVEVTDDSITRCIADIRKSLCDEQQRIIRTIPRRGYLFAAPVTELMPAPPRPATAVPEIVGVPPSETSKQLKTVQFRWRWAILAPILLAGALAWRVWLPPETAPPLMPIPLITLPGAVRYPSLSPDGDRLAFSWNGPKHDNPDLYIQQIGAGAPMRLTTDTSNDYNPVWSPDGRWIAFLRASRDDPNKSEVLLIAPLGGAERKIAEIRVPSLHFLIPPYLSWCPDSHSVVVASSPVEGNGTGLFVVSLDTGDKVSLTPLQTDIDDTNPAISPDGKWLVFRRQSGGSVSGELYRMPLGSGWKAAEHPERLTPPELDAGYPTWMPDSSEILFASDAREARGSLWRMRISAQNPPRRIPFVGDEGLMPVVSRSQSVRPPRLVYLRTLQDSNVWRVDVPRPGAEAVAPPVLAISSSKRDVVPQLSPDGRRVAFASDRSGTWEVWLSDPDGGNPVQLTFMGTAVAAPNWSPDGARIVFSAALAGRSNIYSIRADGGRPVNLSPVGANDTRPSFSRDGKWIYFSSARNGYRRIWKMPASGGDAIQVTNNEGFAPFESPDARYVYYNQTMNAPSPLWRIPSSGGSPEKVLEGVVLGAFAVLDRGIYYIDRPSGGGGVLYLDLPSGETRLRYFDLVTRQSTTVARNLGNIFQGLTASKDGRSVLYSRLDHSLDDLMLVENFR